MKGKVLCQAASGWWTIKVPYKGTIDLPTFTLPADTRTGDEVTMKWVGNSKAGFWRVLSVLRPLNSKYGRRHLR